MLPPTPEPREGESFVGGNLYDKYRTANPVYRHLMGRFLSSSRELLALVPSGPILEVGCGPGDLTVALWPPPNPVSYIGLDLDLHQVQSARSSTRRSFVTGSALELPLPDRSFETVIACEVLEHLDDPDRALAEIARVGSGYVLVSVPWEPVWRLLNMARGSYLSRLGNTPGHLRNFSRRQIRRLVGRHLAVVAERRPFPWTMLLARIRPQ